MATVLKRGTQRSDTPDASPRPAAFMFSDMASQGTDYVQQVQAEAAKAIQQAHDEAAEIRRQAEAAGQAAAQKNIAKLLDERVGAELNTLRPALDALVGELQSARGEWLQHWRASAIGLATAMAERIVRRELRDDPAISEAWLTESLQLAAGASDLTIRVAPSDLDHLRGHAERLAESMAGIAEARFVADPEISPGGCRVETRHGSIDQQLETQLERLTEELN